MSILLRTKKYRFILNNKIVNVCDLLCVRDTKTPSYNYIDLCNCHTVEHYGNEFEIICNVHSTDTSILDFKFKASDQQVFK